MTLDATVYRALKEDIVSLRIRGGQFLSEEKLSKRFKVSRTPVRSALKQLNHDGLVEMIPKKGAFVSAIDIDTIRDMFQIREGLEGIAAKYAASRFDESQLKEIERELQSPEIETAAQAGQKLHQYIFEVSENKMLFKIYEMLRTQMTRIYNLGRKIPDRDTTSIEEHKTIIRVLKTGDGDLAEAVVRKHIKSTMQSVFESLSKFN